MNQLAAVLAAAAAAGLVLRQRAAGGLLVLPDGWQQLNDPDQTASAIDQALTMLNPTTYTAPEVLPDQAARNERAFLDAIAWAEGTARGPRSGYDVLFGWPAPGRTFNSEWSTDHPRILFDYTDLAGRQIKTSAAGRYQITRTTFDALVRKYPDRFAGRGMAPATQDHMALTLIEERGALGDVRAGAFARAVSKVRSIWASLPGAGANQPERGYPQLLAAYQLAGGTLET